MELYLIIWVFFTAFFIESVFWFGWLLLSFALLSLFWVFADMKEMVYLGWYVAMIASIVISITDFKSFSPKKLKHIIVWALGWAIMWTLLFNYLRSDILLKVLAVFIFVVSLKNIFFDKLGIKINEAFKKWILILAGFIQGLFGT